MNRELESLILAYEAVSAARDAEAERCIGVFNSLLDDMLDGHPGVSRETLRKSIHQGASPMGVETGSETTDPSAKGVSGTRRGFGG